MDETKKRFPKTGGIFFTVAVFTFAAAGFFYLNGHRIKPAETEEAVFGGWVYRSDDQKNVTAVLAKAQVTDYRWEEGRLMVPSAKRGMCERILGENKALPTEPSDAKREALTEMTQFESESKTRMRDLYSSARQLEQTLAQFESIESATVGVWTRREQNGLMPKTITTATVGVQLRHSGFELTPELVSAITLSAKHQLGIAENENISIMDLRNGRSYLGDDRAVGVRRSAEDDERYRQEEYWREKFRSTFASIPGLQVSSTVDWNETVSVPNPASAEPLPAAMQQPQLGPIETEAGTLVFRPDAETAENDSVTEDALNESSEKSNPSVSRRTKRIAVVLGIPESYVQPSGEHSVETIRQMAESVLSTSDTDPEDRTVRICLYADGPVEQNTAQNSLPLMSEKTSENASEEKDNQDNQPQIAQAPALTLAEPVSDQNQIVSKAAAVAERMEAFESTLDGDAIQSMSWTQRAQYLFRQAVVFIADHPNESLIGGSFSGATLLFGLILRFFRKKRPVQGKQEEAKTGSRPAQDPALFYLDPEPASPVRQEAETGIEIAGRIEDDPRRAAEIIQEWIRTGA